MDVLMPQLGETVAEGKISTWFRSVGDAVKPGDNLFEIETDKVSMEVPSISAGVLAEIRVPAGGVAPVGAIVAVISDQAGATTSPQAAATGAPPKTPVSPPRAPAPAAGAPAAVQHAAAVAAPIVMDPFREVRTPEQNFGPAKQPGGAVTTPLARRLAGEAGIDLSRLVGSGPHGRIVARDVEAARAARPAPAAAVSSARGASAEQVKALYRDVPFEELPLDNMRRTIASRMVQAAQSIPHFYLSMDVTLDALLALREQANAAAGNGAGSPPYKLSVNDFVIKAMALALRRVPAANAVWAEDRILRFTRSDVAVAVAIENGLLTPVIRGAEAKTISAISSEMRYLAVRAHERKLNPAEYQGGSTAISNLGMYGIRDFTAIINPPHATILAVGAAQRRPIETADGGVRFVSQMTVTLSCDHRVVDGALGAELLTALKGFVEQPVTMLV